MINLKGFNHRDLQTLTALITHCEGQGVLDIRVIRTEIDQELHFVRADALSRKIKTKIKHRHMAKQADSENKATLCPSCGKRTENISVDGETIISCRACRWSALAEVC